MTALLWAELNDPASNPFCDAGLMKHLWDVPKRRPTQEEWETKKP